MVNVRGVNIYPAAIEEVIREIADVVEYRCTVRSEGSLRTVSIDVELVDKADTNAVATRVENELRLALGLTVPVTPVTPGVLPRFELKANRFLVER